MTLLSAPLTKERLEKIQDGLPFPISTVENAVIARRVIVLGLHPPKDISPHALSLLKELSLSDHVWETWKKIDAWERDAVQVLQDPTPEYIDMFFRHWAPDPTCVLSSCTRDLYAQCVGKHAHALGAAVLDRFGSSWDTRTTQDLLKRCINYGAFDHFSRWHEHGKLEPGIGALVLQDLVEDGSVPWKRKREYWDAWEQQGIDLLSSLQTAIGRPSLYVWCAPFDPSPAWDDLIYMWRKSPLPSMHKDHIQPMFANKERAWPLMEEFLNWLNAHHTKQALLEVVHEHSPSLPKKM